MCNILGYQPPCHFTSKFCPIGSGPMVLQNTHHQILTYVLNIQKSYTFEEDIFVSEHWLITMPF